MILNRVKKLTVLMVTVCACAASVGAWSDISCEVTGINQWNSGYQADVVVTNDGTASVNSWEIEIQFSLAPNMTASWNAIVSESESALIASNLGWNGSLAAGATASFGFTGTSSGDVQVVACVSTSAVSASSSSVNMGVSSASVVTVSSVSIGSSLASSQTLNCTEMCKWYQDDARPVCENQSSGWGWENNQTCIGSDTCSSQFGGGGIIDVCDTPVSSTSSANSSLASSATTSIASSVVSSVTADSSSSLTFISSSSTGLGAVNVFTDLPDEMVITSDAERIEAGGHFKSDFFDDTELETVSINFSQSNYQQLLEQNYDSKTEIGATLTYKGKVYEQVGVRYRGMTSYMSAGTKKSFSIELDWAIEGQDIDGYNSFKLNNAYEDPSNMREVLYNNLATLNIPAAKASFARVVVNGEDYGVYAKIQKLDKDHVKEWFLDKDNTRWRAEAPNSDFFGGVFGGGFGGGFISFDGGGFGGIFGAGTSTLNDLGANGSAYENAYTLKYADVVDPWQDIANAAHVMATASQSSLIEELGQYMDIDAALWMIATENLFVDDDGYINKGGMDYYVYFDVATNRILPIEYDGNSVLASEHASSWTPFYNEEYETFPLLNILLSVPELRQRYLAHYRTLAEESLNPQSVGSKIDAYASLIDSAVSQASVRQYSASEYRNAVSALKQVVSTRYNYVTNNSEVNRQGPTISNVSDSVGGVVSIRPQMDQSVTISASVSASSGLRGVNLYYGEGLAGRFTRVSMQQSGGQYSAVIPAYGKGKFVRYYIEAVANDSAGTAAYSPVGAEHDIYVYQVVSANSVASAVVINEVMAANKSVVVDEEGDYGDWIELYNTSNQPVNLTGYYLTDEEDTLDRWAFPAGSVIPANGTLVVWADGKADLSSGLHADFKLSASGENVYLVTPELHFADSVTFTDAADNASYARSPNGSGGFSWSNNPTFNAAN